MNLHLLKERENKMKRNMTALDYAKAAMDTMMRKFDAADLPPKGRFHYHQGVFLSGVYSNYLLCGEEKYFRYMKDWVDAMIYEDGSIKEFDPGQLDDIQPGNLIFPIYERAKEERYKNTLDILMEIMKKHPKNREGGFWHKKHLQNQMWLDGLYMGGPFVCKYAKVFEQPEYFDISIEQAFLMREKTEDKKTGLWYHAYDCERTQEWANKETGCAPEFWGRSIGWVPVAILEELDDIPETHPKYQQLCELVRDLLTAICNFQSEEGRWYQVVDKGELPGNWLENSCSCLYVAAIYKAVRKGILENKFLMQAQKGYDAVINSLTWEGENLLIGNVCIGTGVGDYQYYCDRPTSTNDLHGVGAFLIMCGEAARTSEK